MKLRDKILKAVLIVGGISLLNVSYISASESLDANISTDNERTCIESFRCKDKSDLHKGNKHQKNRGVDELKEKGILNDDDIKNINEYYRKHKDEIRKEILEDKFRDIDNMVKEKFLTKEKGEALKQFLQEKFESRNKE